VREAVPIIWQLIDDDGQRIGFVHRVDGRYLGRRLDRAWLLRDFQTLHAAATAVEREVAEERAVLATRAAALIEPVPGDVQTNLF
jgi:hypothetical protein